MKIRYAYRGNTIQTPESSEFEELLKPDLNYSLGKQRALQKFKEGKVKEELPWASKVNTNLP